MVDSQFITPDSPPHYLNRLELLALLSAFAHTSNEATGVQMIFLDYDLQRRLYAWARARGTPDAALAFVLQYPRGASELAGLVRHWPNHTDHLHVRFKPAH